MISFCNESKYCSKCGSLVYHYYERYSLVLCINCIDYLCDEYFKYKREKFSDSDYDLFREFLENE